MKIQKIHWRKNKPLSLQYCSHYNANPVFEQPFLYSTYNREMSFYILHKTFAETIK